MDQAILNSNGHDRQQTGNNFETNRDRGPVYRPSAESAEKKSDGNSKPYLAIDMKVPDETILYTRIGLSSRKFIQALSYIVYSSPNTNHTLVKKQLDNMLKSLNELSKAYEETVKQQKDVYLFISRNLHEIGLEFIKRYTVWLYDTNVPPGDRDNTDNMGHSMLKYLRRRDLYSALEPYTVTGVERYAINKLQEFVSTIEWYYPDYYFMIENYPDIIPNWIFLANDSGNVLYSKRKTGSISDLLRVYSTNDTFKMFCRTLMQTLPDLMEVLRHDNPTRTVKFPLNDKLVNRPTDLTKVFLYLDSFAAENTGCWRIYRDQMDNIVTCRYDCTNPSDCANSACDPVPFLINEYTSVDPMWKEICSVKSDQIYDYCSNMKAMQTIGDKYECNDLIVYRKVASIIKIMMLMLNVKVLFEDATRDLIINGIIQDISKSTVKAGSEVTLKDIIIPEKKETDINKNKKKKNNDVRDKKQTSNHESNNYIAYIYLSIFIFTISVVAFYARSMYLQYRHLLDMVPPTRTVTRETIGPARGRTGVYYRPTDETLVM